MVITFCGQKGGTGKTTLSYLVAETLSRAGKKVAIRDDDPQASVSQIVNELRESGRTAVEILDPGMEGNYDFIVVDTLPRLSSRVLVEAVKEADRLILPLKPSMVDIRATVPAVQMVQENIRSAARAFVLWNMVKPGTKISRELEGLEAMLGLPVLKVAVPERIGFTYASLQGYDTVPVEDRSLLQRLVLEFLV
jgi:chromosome partitioning protein